MSQPVDITSQIHLTRDFPRDAEEGLFQPLAQALNASPSDIWLNCAQVERITSHGVGVLWQAYEQCAKEGVDLHLADATEGLQRTLSALDLCEFFGVQFDSGSVRAMPEAATESSTGVYTDTFKALEADVDRALTQFGDHVRAMDLGQSLEFELQTLFYEAATNIRHHGGLEPGQQVTVTLVARKDTLALSFADPGKSFDPTRYPVNYDYEKAAKSGQVRGFGLALMRRMTDQITYSREDGTQNLLTLIKKREA